MRNKSYKIFTIIVLVSIAVSACVKEIFPDLNTKDSKKVVVSGQLTDISGYQYVSVSNSSDVVKSYPDPIENCVVKFESSAGTEYQYTEYAPGEYKIWLDSASLDYTLEYRLIVITPNNNIIKSSWEKFNNCPEINKVYYEIEESSVGFRQKPKQGLRFYLDFVGAETDSRYYKIELVETFEYHTQYPIEWWYDGVLHHEIPPDFSRHICYNIIPIREIYTLSTDNLNKNEYMGFKLNYVDNLNQRLSHTYSLLFRQLALDFKAFTYWNQMRINMNQEGGLYTNQPIAIKGNMYNETDSTLDVLGYFLVAKAAEKRIFIPPPGIDVIDNNCSTLALRNGVRNILPSMYPGYLMGDETGPQNVLLSAECVDCTTVGNGKTTKPDYWP